LIIEISNLTFNAIIGILDFERKSPQKIVIDLKLKYNYKKDFLNYVELRDLIISHIKTKKYKLLEEALIGLENEITKKYEINYLYIKISKPEILQDCTVSLANKWHYQVS
jgi:dihydroneopterin aldolase